MDATTNYEFRIPLGNEDFDIGHQNFNWQQADIYMGVHVCTSTTRPSSPKDGQQIYETDTGQSLVWRTDLNPDAWFRTTSGAIAGQRYEAANATLLTATSNTLEQLALMETQTVLLEANRTYKVSFLAEYDSTALNDRALFRIRSDNLAGIQWGAFQTDPYPVLGVRQHALVTGIVFTGGAANLKFVLTLQRTAGTGTHRIYKSNTSRPYSLIELMGSSTVMAVV